MGKAAMVSGAFAAAARQAIEYYDVAMMGVLLSSFQAHDDFVENVVARNGYLYSSGDRKCKLWDPTTGKEDVQRITSYLS